MKNKNSKKETYKKVGIGVGLVIVVAVIILNRGKPRPWKRCAVTSVRNS